MPVERASEHPTFEIAGNIVTSLAAPSRGSSETALFRTEVPAGGGLPPHRHDHFDVFIVLEGGVTMHIGDETTEVGTGDSVVVPTGELHWLEAGAAGATIVVTMVAATRLIREDDGTVIDPPWVN